MSFLMGRISIHAREVHHHTLMIWSETRRLVFASLMAVLSTLLQAAGGYLPGGGFFISPFTTLPIIIVTIISLRYGLLTYLLTGILLLLIEPSDLFIYPFTTGMLGLTIGFGFRLLHDFWRITLLGGIVLSLGICFPLYILKFPVFGPAIQPGVGFYIVILIVLFSFIYTGLWLWISFLFIKRIKGIFID